MAELLKIHPENPQPRLLNRVVEVLQAGGVIVYPTDTVYAFGCDLHQPKALDRVARLKGLKKEKADFSIIFYDLSHLADYTRQVDTPTYKMLKKALPGPYTFILTANNTVPKLFKNKKRTIGIRIPDNLIPRTLAEQLGHPLIASSVHDEDEILEYTTDPELILEKYGHAVDLVIDGGMGELQASTVVDATGEAPQLIRQGKGAIDWLP
jgi:tRNA threonylcarbamoyl adenosine modification protein (Sua5/YciO/YrdC/YwlC family)